MWQSIKGIIVAGGWVLLAAGVAILCTILLVAFALQRNSALDTSPMRPPSAVTGSDLPGQAGESPGEAGSGGADTAGEDAVPVDAALPLKEDLSLVESAIAEIGAALMDDPDNESLKGLLVSAYRSQMMLLKKSLHLVADEAELDED